MNAGSGARLLLAAGLIATCARAWAFDLSGLPPYRPASAVSGTIRNNGIDMGGMVKVWEEGFRRFQPGIRFEDKLPSSDAAIGSLTSETADLALVVREAVLTEYFAFYETFGYNPTGVVVASGSYDAQGMACGPVVYVRRDNPIARLTLKQLDGIFGSERTGGYDGFVWKRDYGRGARDDIRTWGQLGLTGEWTDRPIHTYGHAYNGTTNFFELKVFHGGDKWNPNYREYVEGGKSVAVDDTARLSTVSHMLDELSGDRYGIGWTIVPLGRRAPELKPVALAATEGGPYVEPSPESFQNRTYPLTRSVYIYLNRRPGTAIDPKVREWIRYILSREGQEAVAAQGGYLPLPADVAREQLKKLD
jgi:phosphate transport system substrate-binding protein